MAEPSFNPSEEVLFDLAYGHVHLDGAPTRIMVPDDTLLDVCEAAGEEATAALGNAMGKAMGHRAALRIGADADDRRAAVKAATPETVVDHLAAELALAGVGALSLERWGRAVVFVHDQSPFGPRGDVLIAEILQAAVQELTNQPVRVVRLERRGVRARYVVVSAAIVENVKARLGRGDSWGQVLAQLHVDQPEV